MEEKITTTTTDDLIVTNEAKGFMREVSKWTKFLSILGFIGTGIMAFASVILLFISFITSASSTQFGSLFGGISMGLIAFLYLILALIYFIPINYLFRFSNNLKSALDFNNQNMLTDAFGYLKSHYKFIGIMTIVMICVYIVFIIFTVISIGTASATMFR